METLSGQSSSLSSTLHANYNERFANQSQVLSNLNSLYTPIAQAGPDQQGFGANELAALNTQAGEGVGNNYAKASLALGNQLATRGGGSEVLPTGARASLQASLASAAADQLSNEQLGITRANFAQGRQNWTQATAGLHSLASQYDPTGFSSQAIGANNAAFGQATKIQEMKNQKQAAIASGITSLAGSALTFGAGGLANLGDGGWDTGAFFSGGVQALGDKGQG